MSIKKESWQESLEQVRSFIKNNESEQTVEETVEEIVESNDETVTEEIEELLRNEFSEESIDEELVNNQELIESEEAIKKLFKISDKKATMGIANLLNMTSPKVLKAMQKQNPKGFERMAKKMGELPAMEEVEEDVSIEKLAERNMLGRLAKSLRLNEEGKQKMFAYFEKGELKQ